MSMILRRAVRAVTAFLCAGTFVGGLTTTAQAAPLTATYTFSDLTLGLNTTEDTAISTAPTGTGATFGQFQRHGTLGAAYHTGVIEEAGAMYFRWGTFVTSPSTAGTVLWSTTWLSVTISPAPTMTLQSLTFDLKRQSASLAPWDCVWRSSLDSYANNLGTMSISPTNPYLSVVTNNVVDGGDVGTTFHTSDNANIWQTGCTITLDSSFANLSSPVTFQFYGIGPNTSGGKCFGIDNVTFTYTVPPGGSVLLVK